MISAKVVQRALKCQFSISFSPDKNTLRLMKELSVCFVLRWSFRAIVGRMMKSIFQDLCFFLLLEIGIVLVAGPYFNHFFLKYSLYSFLLRHFTPLTGVSFHSFSDEAETLEKTNNHNLLWNFLSS